jgi:hypothetical protein
MQAIPGVVSVGQIVTVVMVVTNNGQADAIGVRNNTDSISGWRGSFVEFASASDGVRRRDAVPDMDI